MTTSELVTRHHLTRKAIIYIRQSTPHQLLSNQESLRLQYALRQRAIELGWSDDNIEVIDSDLGITAATAQQRPGFKELLAQVTLGLVGIILSYDVTRLSRNCSDWYPLLDLCGYKSCLIADRDGVYDPGSANGRLLLGLKGQISEVELHTIRSRLNAGILSKAQRGELALTLPVGLVRDELGVVHKDPNREVIDRINLVFEIFGQRKSASKVLQMFNSEGLLLPRRNRFGDIVWRKPSVAAILSILKNPAYAGAFVYGRTRTLKRGLVSNQPQQKHLPMAEWKIRVNDIYPAYISWQTYERNQAQLMDNYAEYDRNKTRGIPRPGAALLHGLVYCGECGHKMVVQYKGVTRYICNYLRQQYRVPVCQYIPADVIDEYVVNAFLEALSAVELDAYHKAVKTQQQSLETVERAHSQQIERLQYQVALAERQFNRVDPDNRLVAAELEQRWENALRELKLAQENYAQRQQPQTVTQLPKELKTAFINIGQRLPELWHTGTLTQVQKKSLLRCLIDKVVIHRLVRDTVRTRIIWKGGDTTTVDLPIPVGSLAELTNADELETQVVAQSLQGIDDQVIAQQLTAQGHRSPLRTTLLPSTVKTIRLKHRIFQNRSQSHPRQISGYLTVPQVAKSLELSPHWIYDRIHKGTIAISKDESTGLYLFPDVPDTLEQFQKLKAGLVYNLRF
ncbi:recombinase family protein [Mastigocladopsis repens]|uniref:recombinase family protein n=1 Tax=Mastigocladopsis repens TaxID=221287 RepID=UPI0002F89874|nr:recombinase family protein [Mastigocladopsis repens]